MLIGYYHHFHLFIPRFPQFRCIPQTLSSAAVVVNRPVWTILSLVFIDTDFFFHIVVVVERRRCLCERFSLLLLLVTDVVTTVGGSVLFFYSVALGRVGVAAL